jgi:hypothetical protein
MMADLTPSPEGERPTARGDRDAAQPSAAPLADREVPLRADGAMAALNAWLDGEGPAPRLANNQLTPEAELWSKIGEATSARRQVRTPQHVAAQIMASLPESAPGRMVAAPAVTAAAASATAVATATRVSAPAVEAVAGVTLQPLTLTLLALACLALGALLGKML